MPQGVYAPKARVVTYGNQASTLTPIGVPLPQMIGGCRACREDGTWVRFGGCYADDPAGFVGEDFGARQDRSNLPFVFRGVLTVERNRRSDLGR